MDQLCFIMVKSNMSYQVIIDGVNETQWMQYAQDFADYSIYQTCAYQQVRCETDGSQIHRLLVKSDDGAVLAMCHIRVHRIRSLGLKVGYGQWGPLLRMKNGAVGCPAGVFRALRDACFGLSIDVLRLVPNIVDDVANKQFSDALKESGFERLLDVPPYHTTIVPLDSEADLRMRLHQSWRRMLHKAEAVGVDIQERTDYASFEVLEHFYTDLAQRKGLKGVDPDVFARAQQVLPESEKMCLVVGYIGHEPVTVHVTSNLGNTGVFLLSASSKSGYEHRASYLAWWRAMVHSGNIGMKNYDTGGIDSIKAPDIARFKSGVGGRELSYIGTFEAYADRRTAIIWKVSKRIYQLMRW